MRRLFAITLTIAFIAAIMSGCIGSRKEEEKNNEKMPEPVFAPRPHVVVAIIDTGINPYHEVFSRPDETNHPSTWLEGFSEEIAAFELTFGDIYADNYEADKDKWTNLKENELVWFTGTNVAAISMQRDPVDSAYPVLDNGGHGTLVASSVLEACPDAFIVSIQIENDPDIVAANEWAAKQPWIDIVTTSWGKAPEEYAEETYMGLDKAQKLVHEAGKVQTNSAGNDPVPVTQDEHSGPSWNIAVGGALASDHGDAWIAAKFPDVVSDFWQDRLAKSGTVSGYRDAYGTSFSCPRVAGTLAKALYDIRAAVNYTGIITNNNLIETAPGKGMLDDGKLTAGELRTAMNHSAIYWNVTDYTQNDTYFVPVLPGAPWVQMGWGYVNKTMAPTIAAVALGNMPLPEKDPLAVAHNEALYETRVQYWGNYPG